MTILDSDNATTDQFDYTLLEKVGEDLTKQRDKIMNTARALKDGEPLSDHSEIMKKANTTLTSLAHTLATISETDTPEEVEYSQRDLLGMYWEQVKTRANVVKTGFERLDAILSGGLEPGRLVGVLGAPNCGKTTFTHQISENVASLGRPVLYVTSEDAPGALVGKTIARIGDIEYTAVLKGYDTHRQRITSTISDMMKRKSTDRLRYLDATSTVTIDYIENAARKHFEMYSEAKGGGPGVLVIDYLQNIANIMRGDSGSQELRVYISGFARRLHDFAKNSGCTVIIIASQNRNSYTRSNDTGAMASAKESGDIEYACDVLIALNEDRDKNRVVASNKMAIMLYVDKNRQGQRSKSIPLDFTPDRQMFDELGM